MLLHTHMPGTIKLAWDAAHPLDEIGGYIIHYGLESKKYTNHQDVGNVLETVISGLEETTYFFAVSAYNLDRTQESDLSNEVSGNLSHNIMEPLKLYCGESLSITLFPEITYGFFDTNKIIPIDIAKDKAVTLGLKFFSTNAGFIIGLRFYTAALEKQTFTIGLYDDARILLAKRQVMTDLTTPGWIKASFDQAVKIDSNRVYTAAYFTPVGYYAHRYGGLSSCISNGYIFTVADGRNGVYNYTPSFSFPKNSYKNSNYFIDIDYCPNIV